MEMLKAKQGVINYEMGKVLDEKLYPGQYVKLLQHP